MTGFLELLANACANLQLAAMMVTDYQMRGLLKMLASLKALDGQLADPQSLRNPSDLTPMESTRNEWRSIKPEVLVVVGICSHLGCSPSDKLEPGPQPSLPNDWAGGFLCPCHGSTFDVAGRVYKNKPAPDNLEVPPYTFLSDSRLLIGESKAG